MKPEQQNVLKQLRMAIERAHPHIYAPIASDSATYLNMIELRGYLDALSDALEANSHQCDASGSVHRGLRAGMDVYGRMGLCKYYCTEIANALARKDEERLRSLRVLRQEPLQLVGKTNYGDPKEEKEENKEYFTQLDGLLTAADRYIEILMAKWMAHFAPRYKNANKQDALVKPALPLQPVPPIQPVLPLQSAVPLQPALPIQPTLPVNPIRRQFPMNPPAPVGRRPTTG